jgi:hypothetical protein
MTAALKFSVYKGISGKWGALQLNFQKPHFYCPVDKFCPKDFESLWPGQCSGSRDKPHAPTEMKSREGCIFLEITSAIGPNEYDWDKKVNLALSNHDMAKVLYTLETGKECKIMHDPGAKSDSQGKIQKYLTLSCPKGLEVGVLVLASLKNNETGETRTHTVPLSPPEALELALYLRSAIVNSLAW